MSHPRVPLNPNFARQQAMHRSSTGGSFSDRSLLIGGCLIIGLLALILLAPVKEKALQEHFASRSATSLLPTPHTQSNTRSFQTTTELRPSPIVAVLAPVPDPLIGVQDAVRHANQVWAVARFTRDTQTLESVAHGTWLEKERKTIAADQAGGIRERYTLLNLLFHNVEITGTHAIVCTEEQWQRQSITDNGTTTPVEEFPLVERYTLEQQSNSWYVTDIVYGASC